jgi:hypothetical protein
MDYAICPMEIFIDDICNFVGTTEKTCGKGIVYSVGLIVIMNNM